MWSHDTVCLLDGIFTFIGRESCQCKLLQLINSFYMHLHSDMCIFSGHEYYCVFELWSDQHCRIVQWTMGVLIFHCVERRLNLRRPKSFMPFPLLSCWKISRASSHPIMERDLLFFKFNLQFRHFFIGNSSYCVQDAMFVTRIWHWRSLGQYYGGGCAAPPHTYKMSSP